MIFGIAFILSVSAIAYGKNIASRQCSGVRCQPVFCPNPIKGTCCDVCLEDCRVTLCANPPCSNPVAPPGRCCPICSSPPTTPPLPRDCSRIQCFPPNCPNPKPPGPGECCPSCLESCELVSCAIPRCPNSFVPPGRCCPICPGTPDCSAVLCLAPTCPNPIPPPPGECCSKCTEDCRLVRCASPNCINPVTPPGKCCGICPDVPVGTCSLPADPGPCRASIPSWFYNSRTKQCERFTYGGCRGNDNRFSDLRSCLSECGSKCPPGVPLALCVADPCSVTQCPAYPNAICVSNFCGGCNARFFLNDGKEVTDQCSNQNICPAGQAYTACGTSCRHTCEDPQPTSCRKPCSPGCSCPRGTLLDRRVSLCVDSDDCGNCPPDKLPVNCLVNPCTFQTCPNVPNVECLFDNCGGCFARFFVGTKEVTNTCNENERVCPVKGQVFQQCATCPATCDNPDLICIQVCRPGCGCPPGQIIDELNNRCVPRDQCPNQQCQIKGQTFQRCKPCLVTCDTVGQLIPCPLICRPGCGCPTGTVLDEKKNECVKQELCPPKIDCSRTVCPPISCPNPIPPNIALGKCCATCPPGSQCPIRGQIYQQCGGCRATCSNPNPICTLVCRRGCNCPPGTVIDERLRKCVRQQDCQKRNNICLQPLKRGLCRARFLRYYYNSRLRRCSAFIYGGCQGNRNNFRSRYSCERTCQTRRSHY